LLCAKLHSNPWENKGKARLFFYEKGGKKKSPKKGKISADWIMAQFCGAEGGKSKGKRREVQLSTSIREEGGKEKKKGNLGKGEKRNFAGDAAHISERKGGGKKKKKKKKKGFRRKKKEIGPAEIALTRMLRGEGGRGKKRRDP